ncbi:MULTISPECIES: uracil-DNA glycosylase [Ramlibacter]|uniref:Uracil-DNA glycosylase n=1 Tax=Ramlibacter aquaticus TaxID=2780094 RepID=A0ABR9SDJ9_9BURK|nr:MULTISPECIES: uracil-DNA glycosylase [Ramlibacter]MBE7940398.1 uracil-DNA glycosylase [Ramlibacter aquaticus]
MSERLRSWPPQRWTVAEGWQPVLDAFFATAQGHALSHFLRERLAQGAVVYPPQPLRALELTPLPQVRAVVLGQDPYHGPGQAEGLAFSVAAGVRLPPSLRNIYAELYGDRSAWPGHGSLADWARRGVLLLNTSLTVEDGQPGSHAKKGWEQLTDALLERVAATASPCVYLLWGAHAQAKAPLIARVAAAHGRDTLILQANHPSPLSARRPPVPFLGSGHFRQAGQWLAERGVPSVFG